VLFETSLVSLGDLLTGETYVVTGDENDARKRAGWSLLRAKSACAAEMRGRHRGYLSGPGRTFIITAWNRNGVAGVHLERRPAYVLHEAELTWWRTNP